MHIEVIVEDSSGKKLLDCLLPKLWGEQGKPHTWRIHDYKGVGHLPKGLKAGTDPAKRVLLNHLPRLLGGLGKTQGIDAVVVVMDVDKRDCVKFLAELKGIARKCGAPNTLFRLAVEETEAWYLGDRTALEQAYPRLKSKKLEKYVQDSVCGTWELLADAVYPGGSTKITKEGWPLEGDLKHEWAEKIAPLMDPEKNQSPSFQKLRDGLRRLVP